MGSSTIPAAGGSSGYALPFSGSTPAGYLEVTNTVPLGIQTLSAPTVAGNMTYAAWIKGSGTPNSGINITYQTTSVGYNIAPYVSAGYDASYNNPISPNGMYTSYSAQTATIIPSAGGSGQYTLESSYAFGSSSYQIGAIYYINGKWFAAGFGGSNNNVIHWATSINSAGAPTAWGAQGVGSAYWCGGMTYGNGTYVIANTQQNYVAYSSNGTSWATATTYSTAGWGFYGGVAYGNGIFVGRSNSTAQIMTSTNGTTWSLGSIIGSAASYPNGISYYNGYFIAGDNSGNVWYSTNASAWSSASAGLGTTCQFVSSTFSNGVYFANFNGGAITQYGTAYSTNLATWTVIAGSYAYVTGYPSNQNPNGPTYPFLYNPGGSTPSTGYSAGQAPISATFNLNNKNDNGTYFGYAQQVMGAVDNNGGVLTAIYMAGATAHNQFRFFKGNPGNSGTIAVWSGATPTVTI